MKTGIALLNFGGPWTIIDVKPFLYRLFKNPSVLVGIPTGVRHLVAFVISRVKGPSSIRSYELIGGGSPQLRWTMAQADALSGLFGNNGVRVEIGMRTAEPSIEHAITELRDWGAERLILMPLFPQFSTTTSGTCFDEAFIHLRRLKWNPFIKQIDRWPDHPDYVALLRRTIDESIKNALTDRGNNSDPIHVLFSAHSLPMKIVERGDPYPIDVERTVKAATESLNHPWSLSFQSRNGRMPWIEPYTEDELKRLGSMGVKRLVVVPISFVSDHIETLYELDMLYADLARSHGIEHYYRARAFNDDPEFARALRSILAEAGV